jgi:hypothetical protein
MTIDLNDLSKKEILELEKQLREYKKTEKFLTGYKITFAIRFNPEKHKDDMLTVDGEPDPDVFADYLADTIAAQIESDFNLNVPEEVSGFDVEIFPDVEMKKWFN